MASDWFVFAEAALAVAIVMLALILFPLARWRRRADDREPVQFRNNYPLEIGWTAVPLVIVAGLFAYTYRAEARVDAVAANPAVVVHVSAYRWGWQFAYRGGPTVGGPSDPTIVSGTVAPPPQLVLPLGETTRIDLTALDVNHGFWVPDFLFKRDAIAGETTSFDLDPDKLGTFLGRCSSFCGLEHANMIFTVRVVTPRAFGRWESERS
jgi:cytochrome c oxidase subunit 2